MIVVADAGPIIALSSVALLDLLPALYHRVIVPRAVYDEVVSHGVGLPGSRELAAAAWVEVAEPTEQDPWVEGLRETLDAGEAAALALAARLAADWVLIDDVRGRQTARRMGLEVKGTLGVLVIAKRKGLIDRVAPALDALAAGALWIGDALRARVLAEVGE